MLVGLDDYSTSVTITLPDTILWANGQEQNITPVITGVVAVQSLDYTLTSGLTDSDTTTIRPLTIPLLIVIIN